MLLMKLWQVMMTQKNLIINTKVFKEIFKLSLNTFVLFLKI